MANYNYNHQMGLGDFRKEDTIVILGANETN